MNNLTIYALKSLRKIYTNYVKKRVPVKPACDDDPDAVSAIIYNTLINDKPAMIGRFGSTELTCLVNYLSIKDKNRNILGYIKRNSAAWWWEDSIINQMQEWSGFFPSNSATLKDFSELMIKDIPLLDVLGSWLEAEKYFDDKLTNCKKVELELLNPYFSHMPWTKALENKKVLVIHPFASSIERQYKKRNQLFQNNLLPDFELQTIKAVQSIAGNKTEFGDWFDALNYMKSQIDECDFDICLIGCGAYGFPLAAHVKRIGKKGFHLGGSLQLLFGIRGKRWESESYNSRYNYAKLMNEYWIKPGDDEKPSGASKVEGACYW